MKKIISLFMVLTMVLSLAACSTNQSPSVSPSITTVLSSTLSGIEKYTTRFFPFVLLGVGVLSFVCELLSSGVDSLGD